MDLRQLTYFVAVAEERHIGRAAERLCLSQPPLTRHIKALEGELGVDLFTRTPRGMLLTQAGEALLRDARNIFGLVDRASQRAQMAGLGKVGHIDVGIYGSGSFGVIPAVLARFQRENPDVEIALHYAQTPNQISALREGRVLIVFERLLPNEPDLEVELVSRERLLVAVGERHRFAGLQVIPVSALEGETLRLGSSPSAAATVVEMCRANGFEPRFAPAAGDLIMATLLTTVAGGAALVPASLANVCFPGVSYVELDPGGEWSMDIHCFYVRGESSPLLSAMLRTVRGFREELPVAAPSKG
ncbi:MAG: LysR family transcriptional regulator [Ramlibacter sp.]|jgi:DNA-binding transcriptional LysR family regulator|nr:LysR family transcriptional regulator [Ramlibacter sp.]MDB5915277.1 LysR family transcriptional regulator [Ramlibacter sp.]